MSDETINTLIDDLAAKLEKDPIELRTELAAAGPEYPFDSVWLVSAGAATAGKMGVRLTHLRDNATAFKSVTALADFLEKLRASQAVRT